MRIMHDMRVMHVMHACLMNSITKTCMTMVRCSDNFLGSRV